MDLATTLALGRALGYDLPESITLLVAEAKDLLTVREELSAEVRDAVPRAAALAADWMAETGAFSPMSGRSHDQARVLS